MFPRRITFAALAVDAAVFAFIDGALNVRLITTYVPAFKGKRALPGALIQPRETANEAVVRVLKEKAGVVHGHIEQVYTFSKVNRDPRGRVVSVAYMVLLDPAEAGKVLNLDKTLHQVAWEPVKQVRGLAYDHDEILATTLARLRGKIEYTDIIRHLLPREFTLTELQEAFEEILKRTLDKRNFRKKILAEGVLKQAGKSARSGAHRPAALYTFTNPKKGPIDLI